MCLCNTVTGLCVYVLQLPVMFFLGTTVTCTCFSCTKVIGVCVYVPQLLVCVFMYCNYLYLFVMYCSYWFM